MTTENFHDETPPKMKRTLSESDQNKEENDVIKKLKQEHATEKAELEKKLQNEILQQQKLIEENKEIENKFELEKQSKIEWEKKLIEMEDKFKAQQNNKRQEVLNNFGNLMESELRCAVCSELFVKASALNCMHTFCEYCITEWKKQKNECPVCRTVIISVNRILALDSFIKKMVENLTEDMKTRRQDIIKKRFVQEKKPNHKLESNPSTSQSSADAATRLRAAAREFEDSTSSDDTSTDISTSSDSSSMEEDEFEDRTSDDSSTQEEGYWFTDEDVNSDSEDNNDELVRGVGRAYYGGYGRCYNCGRRGHWVNGCPQISGYSR